ncbi:MAG TPA: DUF3089 domain-containing protein [Chitinophagaceae bacterium]|jgi:hypothetical protein|nr:DUF3089 domain-containing protein [Chitinophagaceae bacterium]
MSRSTLLAPVLLLVILCSCNKHHYPSQLYTFKSADGAPDYSQLDYWAAHPWKWDPSDSVPAPLRDRVRDSTVDVFFLHPTTLTSKKRNEANAAIDDAELNAKTDYSTILYQASVFNEQGRVFAPRYRQAHLRNFFIPDTVASNAAFELAYADIKNAFEYYLQHFNNGHPIIIASHSQGSKLAERLLKDYFEGKTLYNKLVVAYIAGWPVPKEYFTTLRMCADSLQTGCICSWRTFRKGYVPEFLANEKGNSYVTNPLNWTSDETYAPKQLNRGSVLTKFNKIYKQTTDAQIGNGFLYVKKPVFPWSFLYFTRNYHIGDINLFYLNIREDMRRRIGLFWKY